MLVSFLGDINEYKNFKSYSNHRFQVFWQGIIFCRGLRAGEESVVKILKDYEKNLKIDFNSIYGSYIIAIIDKINQKKIFFTDNSKMRTFYIGKKYISDSFLTLIEKEPYLSYNKETLMEFLTLGIVYFEKTIYNEISLSKSENYYEVNKEQTLKIHSKLLYSIDDSESILDDVDLFFKDISYAVEGMHISFDITGGFDSRMVLVEMEKSLPEYNLMISGPPEAKDVIIAKKIASILNKKIDHFNINLENFSEKDLKDIFYYTEGTLLLVEHIREKYLNKYRKEKKYDIRITGDGGVLHKDWWWIQDIPFYNKKLTQANSKKFLNRFYNQRISFINYSEKLFSDSFKEILRKQKKQFIERCQEYVKKTNSETYDMLYFYVSGSKRSFTYNSASKYLIMYAPLWERELVRYSYHLPRWKRFNNNYQKDVITRLNLKISKERTYYGITACSKNINKMLDIPFYLYNLIERALLMLERKFINKNKESDVDVFKPYDDIYKMVVFSEAIEYAYSKGIISDKIGKKQIPDEIIDALLNIYLLSRFSSKNIELL